MRPPSGTEIFDTPLATSWLDDDGILHSVGKKADRTIQNYEEVFKLYKQLIAKGHKICILADASGGKELNKKTREYLAIEFPKYINAIAFISASPFGNMLSNLFLKIQSNALPMKSFTNEKEAKEWLKQYL